MEVLTNVIQLVEMFLMSFIKNHYLVALPILEMEIIVWNIKLMYECVTVVFRFNTTPARPATLRAPMPRKLNPPFATTEEGTEAAGQFLVNTAELARTLQAHGIDPAGPPCHFQILFQVRTMAGSSSSLEVVACHRLAGPVPR